MAGLWSPFTLTCSLSSSIRFSRSSKIRVLGTCVTEWKIGKIYYQQPNFLIEGWDNLKVRGGKDISKTSPHVSLSIEELYIKWLVSFQETQEMGFLPSQYLHPWLMSPLLPKGFTVLSLLWIWNEGIWGDNGVWGYFKYFVLVLFGFTLGETYFQYLVPNNLKDNMLE